MAKITDQDARDYHHLNGKPGKIAVVPTKPMDTQRDLGLAYTPVWLYRCWISRRTGGGLRIYVQGKPCGCSDKRHSHPRSGRSRRPGKQAGHGRQGVLFKKFADVDVFDIEVDSHDPDEVINVARAIAPTFGGINLEDIKAPECFYIEETLERDAGHPVFHDDQHGTAIISSAALANVLEIVGKKHEDIKMVISGAGASAISCAKLAMRWV